MATAVRETVIVAIGAVLQATLPTWTYLRNPARDIDATDLPAVVLLDGGQAHVKRANAIKAYTLNPVIEFYVDAAATAELRAGAAL